MKNDNKHSWNPTHHDDLTRRQLLKWGVASGLALSGFNLKDLNSPAFAEKEAKTAKPVYGGTIITTINTDAPSLDVHFDQSWATIVPANFVYEGLMRYEEEMPGWKLKPILELAESLEQPNDVTYIFHLRKGVHFHDKPPVNGREMTSADVKASFENIMRTDVQRPRAFMFREVDHIEAPDKYTVKFILKKPIGAFLLYVADPWNVVVPAEFIKDEGLFKKDAIGTGPFILEKWLRGEKLVYKKNPNYWEKGLPYLDGAELRIIPDQSTLDASYRTGALDYGRATNWAAVQRIVKTNPKIVVSEAPYDVDARINMNCSRPPFNNKKLRQAILYATDPEIFIKTTVQGQGKRNPPGLSWAHDDALSSEEWWKPDREKAKKLLAEAGYPYGLTVNATVCATMESVPLFEVLKPMLAEFGVELKITVYELGEYLRRTNVDHEFEMAGNWTWCYIIPDYQLGAWWRTGASRNRNQFSSPEFDAVIDEVVITTDSKKRRNLFWKAQRILQDEAPDVWLYTTYSYTLMQPWVHGMKAMRSSQTIERIVRSVWMEKH